MYQVGLVTNGALLSHGYGHAFRSVGVLVKKKVLQVRVAAVEDEYTAELVVPVHCWRQGK